MEKIKVTLACAGGMSTSMLCKKIIEAGKKQNYEVICEAYAVDSVKKVASNSDVVLLGPQAGFLLKKLQAQLPEMPIGVINYSDYGLMNGENVFNLALETLKKNK